MEKEELTPSDVNRLPCHSKLLQFYWYDWSQVKLGQVRSSLIKTNTWSKLGRWKCHLLVIIKSGVIARKPLLGRQVGPLMKIKAYLNSLF